jgi:two-component system, NarL family, nitrate/nitrite response regulator NarL
MAPFHRQPLYRERCPYCHRPLLTRRELEVLTLLCAGLTRREIGRALAISAGTVKVHVAHVYTKLGVGTVGACIAEAYARGLVPQGAQRRGR